jgi:magnesium chelatase subunit D
VNDPRIPERAWLERLLDVVAVTPELDGILVHNASGSQLVHIAELLEARLAAIGPPVDRVHLGASHGEDELWGSGHGLPVAWRRRGLVRPRDDAQLLVIVPDLAQLSISAARAAVTLLETSPAHVERQGESAVVAPRGRLRWLAGLADDSVGQVSPHLVDRFAVQIWLRPSAVPDIAQRVAIVQAELAERGQRRPQLDATAATSLRAALHRRVAIGPGAAGEALASAGSDARGLRRPIALLRVGSAIARLAGDDLVAPAHVQAAATWIGLAGRAGRPGASELRTEASDSAVPSSTPTVADPVQPGSGSELPLFSTVEVADGEPIAIAGEAVAYGDVIGSAERVLASVELGPAPVHDRAAVQREHASLRLPWRPAGGRARGPVIGTHRATSLEDLAVTATLFAAAPFQPLRRREAGLAAETSVILRRSDLRAYRRAPIAEEFLVLVIDYTSVTGLDWQRAILPFLADAYTARAQIALIAVGAVQSGPDEAWRADMITTRSILVPAVAAALDRPAGRSTPLAHGLDLAHRALVHALSHGRNAARRATLVVLSDGRGNVPIAISRGDAWSGAVGRRGIEDARRCARAIRELPHVRRVLIDPQPASLADLPRSLAAALGAEIVLLAQDGAT